MLIQKLLLAMKWNKTTLRRQLASILQFSSILLSLIALLGAPVQQVYAASYSIWPGPVTPGFSYDNPAPIEMGLKFRSDVAGYVTGVRFYKAAGATGTHIGRLWTMGTNKLAEVTFTDETASGWQMATFPTPAPIQANTTYIISYYVADGNRRFSDTFWMFASTNVDNPPLHALAAGVDGLNGVFSDTGGWFNQSYQSSCYWVDLVFSDTAPPPDTTPPTVSSVTPINGATGVLSLDQLTVAFSEAMDATSISTATIELRDPASNLVTATVAYNSSSYTATLAPSASLAKNTTYTARVKSGTAGVKDVAGNPLATDYTWTFATELPDTTPPTVNVVSPVNGASGVLISTSVSAVFSEAMDATTINTGTIELRDPASNLVTATVAYNSSSHTATLAPSASLAKNTTYTASVKSGTTGVKDVAGNPLATDYTWTFTTEMPDTTPPTVNVVSPANGATGVLISTSVSAVFSEAMDATTINTGTIELRDPASNLVTATVAYNSSSHTATLTPSSSLAYNTIYTARVKSGTSGVKDVAGNALATDYTWTFTTETPDTTPPTVNSVMPINGVTRLRLATRATVRFSEAMNASTISSSTIELRDPSNNLVPAGVTYDAGSYTATLTPTANLAYNTTYTARVKSGANGVKDAFNNAMAADYVWSFGTVSQRPPVDQAPGGPILIIASSANLCTKYFTEILRTEGLNEFDITDITQLTTEILNAHDIVILGDMALAAGQVTMLTDWVTAGGHLIAMRPDKQLAGLLGLTDAASTLSNGYLLFDTSSGKPGAGIVSQTLQFHGTADEYTLNGATSLATLYSDRSTQTSYPAVTMRPVGLNGGVACAFTFDLAKSIVLTHQGDPTKTGGGSYQVQPLFAGWVDSSRIAIPQADEQQRFLANLILSVNANKRPLPRFWYLPKGKKAAIILTGDDHWGRSSPSGSSSIFFERHKAQSPPGGSVEDWECIRSSSYGYPGCLMTDAQAAAYAAEGFEFGVHADAGLASGGVWCATWPSDTASQYGAQFEAVMLKYASLPIQGSERNHCYSWFGDTGPAGWLGYAGIPEVEADLGIRFDVNVPYYPGSVGGPPVGYQRGSVMMMRFAQVDQSGVMTKFLDVYNGGTEMTDDNGQGAATMRTIVDGFLDNATGAAGYYGGFVVNMHSDNWYGWSYDGSDQIVASAKAHDIPVVSGRQMTDWLDGRNSSSFGSITWDGTTMAFTVTAATGARNLMGMVPSRAGIVPLGGIARNGTPVAFTTQTIKGVDYAFFPATTGAYVATYAPDTTPPTITGVAANPTSGQTATISWTTDESATSRVDYGTNPGSLSTGATDAALVTQHTVQLTGLLPNTVYYYRVVSADASGNTTTAPPTGSDPATFTTPTATLKDTTFADFSLGTPDGNLYIGLMVDGEVLLKPTVAAEFSGSSLPTGWSVVYGSGTASVGNGVLTLLGATVGTTAVYGPGHSVEAVATFTANPWEHVGFGVTYQTGAGEAWAMISTGQAGTGLLARSWNGSGSWDTQSTAIPGSFFGTPHRYRVDWNTDSIEYYVDGVKVATHNVTISTQMRPLFSVGSPSGSPLTVDWARMTPYASGGVFTSRIFDARAAANWQALSWTAQVPNGATLSMRVRTGDTPAPDGTWSAFTTVTTSGGSIGTTSRYAQYEATFSTTDPSVTPLLQDVSLGYTQDQPPPPLITAVTADPIGAQTATITWTTDVPAASRVDYGTSAGALVMSATDPALVTQHSISLAGLLPGIPYYYRVTSASALGNASTSPEPPSAPATFTTLPLSFTDTTVADFTAGLPDANTYISQTSDGEVILAPTVASEFSGSSLPPGWGVIAGSSSGATVANGVLTVNGSTVGPTGTYIPGHSMEAVATFTAGIHQHVGFGVNLSAGGGDAWAIISTGAGGTSLSARCWTGTGAFDTQSTPINGYYLGSAHRYRVDWNPGSIDYYVDGVKVATHNVTISTQMRPLISMGGTGLYSLSADWLHMSPYAGSGELTSRVFDAGQAAAWSTLAWTADTPAGTTLTMSYRTGNTTPPDGTWTAFIPVGVSGGALAGSSRYLQYATQLRTPDATQTPVLRDVTVNYALNQPPACPDSNAGVIENQTLVLTIAKLLGRASDPDTGDTLSITAAGPTSTNGPANNVVLNTGAGTITYTPGPGYVGLDSFTYTISDNHGATVTPTVHVTVTSAGVPSPNIVIQPTYLNGTFRVTFAGIPGLTYTVQYATDGPSGPWSPLKTATAGANGLFEVTDGPYDPQPPARYYRTVYP